MTIYSGLYFLSKDVGEEMKIVLFVFIVLANTYFIVFWVFCMVEALTFKLAKSKPQLAKKLCCCWKAVRIIAESELVDSEENE